MTSIKITSIAVAPLFGASPKGGWSTEIRPTDSIHALIAVHTDAGITGHGSVFTDGRLAQAAIDVLRPLFEGENALEPERVSEKLHQNTFWMGRGGTLTHAISGIDIALWDILGKVTNQPVGRLLGGVYRRRVRPYCSLLMEEPVAMTDTLRAMHAKGFRAFKIGWGPFGRVANAKLDEAIVRSARDAIGPDAQLFVDAGASDAHWPHGLKWALRTAQMLKEYEVGWFEEALRPDAIDDYRALREASPVPIAGGEVLTRRQAFLPFITGRALDIIQPDLTKCGGLSEARRLGWAAYDHGVLLVPHGWNTAVGVAADLALVAALPVARWVEFQVGVPYVEEIVSQPFKLDAEGMLRIPTGPGLGIELDHAALAKYRGRA